MNIQKAEIITSDHYIIDADLKDYYYGQKLQKKPLVIFTHGFKGFKDWGGFPYMMEKLSKAGFVSVSYNFTFNGVSKENPTEFTRLDLFEQNTYTREANESRLVINHFINNADNYGIDSNNIFLIGHSRGGGITILEAAQNDEVKGIITLASVSTFDRYNDEQKKKWRESGFFDVPNMRTGQLMRISTDILDDIEINKDRLNIIKAVKKINKPFLIVHGKEDLSVKAEEAYDIYENSDKKYSELFLLDNTGHTFGTEHPFKGTTKAFEKVIEKMTEFIKKNLKYL